MTLSSVPILATDLIGAVFMIVLSFLCLDLAFWLKRREPDNIIWTYLQWLCLCLAGFAVSRSAGHILRQILVLSGHRHLWQSISPYSGAFNTLMFVVVGACTLFFSNVWHAYRQISRDREALRTAHGDLLFLNQNLEQMVDDRTRALTQSERKYRRIFEVSRDIILVTRSDGRILDMNPQGLDTLTGPDGESPVGDYFGAFFEHAADWRQIIDTLSRHGFIHTREVVLQRRDGSTLRALLTGSLDKTSTDEDGSIHFLVKDIEQLRQMEKQMAQADKLASIGELSAGIAHEINNPLGVILGYTQLLLRKENADSERHNDLKIIEKHVRNCKSIVEDLLNFSRSSTTRKSANDLNALIVEAVSFITHHARVDPIRLTTELDDALPELNIDDKKMRQVIMNLIMNALHAVDDNGHIRIVTEHAEDEQAAVIRVIDNGHGISPKDLPRIFDPFYTTKPTGEGTGLGLSVSYGIIEDHGGTIHASSRKGKTEFIVTLPVGAAAEERT